MNRYDKLFYQETILASGVSEQACFLVDSGQRRRMIEAFVDEAAMKGQAHPHYFEYFKEGELFGYGNGAVARLLNLNLNGNFFVFIEEGSLIYQVIGWENVGHLISECGSFDLYLASEDLTLIICLTNENHVIMSGDLSRLGFY